MPAEREGLRLQKQGALNLAISSWGTQSIVCGSCRLMSIYSPCLLPLFVCHFLQLARVRAADVHRMFRAQTRPSLSDHEATMTIGTSKQTEDRSCAEHKHRPNAFESNSLSKFCRAHNGFVAVCDLFHDEGAFIGNPCFLLFFEVKTRSQSKGFLFEAFTSGTHVGWGGDCFSPNSWAPWSRGLDPLLYGLDPGKEHESQSHNENPVHKWLTQNHVENKEGGRSYL